MRAVIRADASRWIGRGHVGRCTSLAKALVGCGWQVDFICRAMPGDAVTELTAAGFDVHVLHRVEQPLAAADVANAATAHQAWLGVPIEAEIDEVDRILSDLPGGRVDWLVVDHYGLDARWERAMRRHADRLLALDDLADRGHDVDVLVDQTHGPDHDGYVDLVQGATRILATAAYALVDAAAIVAGSAAAEDVPARAVIYFGPADLEDVTGMAAKAIVDRHPSVSVDLVLGVGHPQGDAIKAWAGDKDQVRVHDSVPSLVELQRGATFAVGAAGVAALERCAMGLASIVIPIADNQQPIARQLAAVDAAIVLDPATVGADLGVALDHVLTENRRQAMVRAGRCLVDGHGTSRIVGCMATVAAGVGRQGLTVRIADALDEERLLAWGNDPLARAMSLNTAPITPATHHDWFAARLADRNSVIMLVEEELDAIGQVRLARAAGQDVWTLSYALAAGHRGRGLSSPMLVTALHALPGLGIAGTVLAVVRGDNVASVRALLTAGFTEVQPPDDTGGDVRHFHLDIPMKVPT